MLEVRGLTVCYGDNKVVDGVSFDVEEGQWLMLIGPNGAGKTSVVHALSGIAPHTGSVRFAGTETARMRSRELARCMGLLSQRHDAGYDFTVEEVIRLGRYAYGGGPLSAQGGNGEEKVQAAIERTGLRPLLGRSVQRLSGGELQRTFFAQLLAQDPKLLLLDEPGNHLDLLYQRELFTLVREWVAEPGRAVVSVVHDLSLARAYGSHTLLLEKGRAYAQGPIGEVMAREKLKRVYGMDVYAWMRSLCGQWEES